MALITLLSATGSPGVTTSALALALHWPGRAVLVEADLAGTSVLPGYLRGSVHHAGLVGLALARSHNPSTWQVRDHLLPLSQSSDLIAGLASPAQARSVHSLWPELATALGSLDRAGVDVLVDLGRTALTDDPRSVLLSASDQVVLVTGSRLPDVYTTRQLARTLKQDDPAVAVLSRLALLVVGPGRPHSAKEIARACELGHVDTLPWDPVAAEVYSVGAPPRSTHASSSLVRATQSLAFGVRGRIEQRRASLAGGEQT